MLWFDGNTEICILEMKLLNSLIYYKSDRTPKPGPGGSPFREVSSPAGSAA